MADWPTYAKQRKICKRGEPAVCVLAGAPGCELCMPCRYTDDQLAARAFPVTELRANHAKQNVDEPLKCGGCFNARPREERERLVADHLVSLYGKKPPEELEFLRREIGRAVAGFPDAQLLEARDWSDYEWRNWMNANLPPELVVGESATGTP